MNEKILKSKCGLEFVITGQDKSRSDGKHAHYFIKFIKSGFTDSVRSDIIRSGFVTDFKDRRLFGVACMGRRIREIILTNTKCGII